MIWAWTAVGCIAGLVGLGCLVALAAIGSMSELAINDTETDLDD